MPEKVEKDFGAANDVLLEMIDANKQAIAELQTQSLQLNDALRTVNPDVIVERPPLPPPPGLFNADYSYRYFSTLLKSIAFRQSASAMLVSPLARRMLRAKLRALANMAGFVRMRLASSSIATSRT